ncbi:MAG: FtsX-like permease family protein [Lewinellaceae bacterium]|nr:FtsX-like permease family protein [Lewinellaceae bacterium]
MAGHIGYNANYTFMALAAYKSDIPKIQAEYADIVSRIPLVKTGDFNPTKITSRLSPYFESMVLETLLSGMGDNAMVWFYGMTTLFIVLFMSLPAINLININISRILERASEIGIRKAFGASSQTLVAQFVIENVIITLLGGLLAILLSGLFLFWFNRSGLIVYSDLSINWKVVMMALLLSIAFGLMSGVYPAWRMSKLPIVDALKA